MLTLASGCVAADTQSNPQLLEEMFTVQRVKYRAMLDNQGVRHPALLRRSTQPFLPAAKLLRPSLFPR